MHLYRCLYNVQKMKNVGPGIKFWLVEKLFPSGLRIADVLSSISIPTPVAVVVLVLDAMANKLSLIASAWPENATAALAATTGSQSFNCIVNGINAEVLPTALKISVRYWPSVTTLVCRVSIHWTGSIHQFAFKVNCTAIYNGSITTRSGE